MMMTKRRSRNRDRVRRENRKRGRDKRIIM